MPWSDLTGGSGRSNGGPWGQGPRNTGGGGGGGAPPDLEELLKRSQERLRQVLPGGGGGRGGGGSLPPIALIAIIAVAVALAGFYLFTFRVLPDEQGVVLRFGEYNRNATPGLNFRLPYPIETVYTPRVTRVNRVSIGISSDERGGAAGRDIPEESLMLTGDENIVDIDFSVFWRIKDASDYLFNMTNPDLSVKEVGESAMREVVGRSAIQPLLTQARQITETDVQQLVQDTLDDYGAGIEITQVQLLKVDPPAEVIAAFRDVQAARADQERLQNEAQTYANRVIPEARGQAAQVVEAANAYRDQIIAEAEGQADRFTKIYDSYVTAPAVTRQRMYLETLEDVFDGMDKVIIGEAGEGATGTGVVPYLPLEALRPATSGGSQ